MKGLFFLFWFAITTISFGQTVIGDFGKFAIQQSDLMLESYEKRDAKAYDKLLKEFLTRYNKLSETDRETYLNHLLFGYYNFSCIYSLLDNKPMAMIYLKKAVDAGYNNYIHIREDSDLDNIRTDKEFKDLFEKLRGIVDYPYILKKAEKYNYSDNRPIPKFTYQSYDKSLMALSKVFNLDSIAGNGNSISKIINLLHWVHYLDPHDGNHENPVVKNVMSLIAECKKDERGLNCRGLCIVLNECYLALGFKSRIVNCLPKDSLKKDTDCHMINAVYSYTYNKWLWMDPTNYAYLMNEKGELLSIEEVRSRVISGEPLILNPDANWHRQAVVTKEYYLDYYMTKNLYMLESPVNSEYIMETSESGKTLEYVRLLPLDYYQQTPDKTEVKEEKSNAKRINYWTNNPKIFWQAP